MVCLYIVLNSCKGIISYFKNCLVNLRIKKYMRERKNWFKVIIYRCYMIYYRVVVKSLGIVVDYIVLKIGFVIWCLIMEKYKDI